MRISERLVSESLVHSSFVPMRKEWIVSAIGVAGSLASSLFGGISASKAAREAERRQRQQEAKEQAWYTRRYNEDYVDTAAGQNLLRGSSGRRLQVLRLLPEVLMLLLRWRRMLVIR